jgi:tRNA (guanine6-N2)-methyltransferase
MVYYLTTLPGLAGVLADELGARVGERVQSTWRRRNAWISVVDWAGKPQELLAVRTAEDVFCEVGRLRLSGRESDLRMLAGAKFWGQPLRAALERWAEVPGRALTKELVMRVVVQADDVQWRRYRRLDLMLAAERALLTAGRSWRLNRAAAPVEVWLHQVERQLLVSVRLTSNAQRQHGGREVERPAALRPSVAAAMVWLSRPADDDIFLDPMCGTGTILLERAVLGRYRRLVGGDVDPAAVAAAWANFGPRHQPRELRRWDATALPLDDAAVTRIACNLPWGRQIGERRAIPALYEGVAKELARVLRPGGRMVLLTSEWDLLKRVLVAQPAVQMLQVVHNVEVLGRRADIFVAERLAS